MNDQTPSAQGQSTVVAAVNRMLPALSELEHLQYRHVELQRKSQKLAERMLGLARAQGRSWSDRRESELVRLDGTANSLQLKLSATQRRTDRLRRRFELDLRNFREIFLHHDLRLSDLQGDNSRTHRQNAGLDRSLRYLIRRLAHLAPGNEAEAFDVPEESYDYIPIGISYFLDALCRLDGLLCLDPEHTHPDRRYRPVRFLEVGSGSGRNMMLVKASEILLWDSVHGFDINPDQIAEGDRHFALGPDLEVADAMTFDYGGHDVIFSYRPFSDLDMQKQLEARIADTMSPFAYLLAPLSFDLALYPDLERVDSHGDIWRKSGAR